MSMEYDPSIEEEKTLRETDAKCPCCGASVQFDPASGHMHCDYCGYERDVPPAEDGKVVQELDFLSAEHTGSHEWGAEKKVVICKSCGAESVYDALQTSDVCPYCGATQVTEAADENSLAPGAVAPFQISKEQAIANFGKWLKSGLFTPSAAKKSCKAEALNGIYLPYWTYDSDTLTNWVGRAGYEYTEKDRNGNTHTKIRWKNVSGMTGLAIDDELVRGSTRHEDAILSRILPFDTSRLVPYSPQYVAGFVSERYSVGLKDGWDIARVSMDRQIVSAIHNEIRTRYRADRTEVSKHSTVFDNVTYKYVMLPIWMSSFKYKDKIYQFMVNGQTGKVGGKMPISALRVCIAILIALGVIGLIAYLGNQ